MLKGRTWNINQVKFLGPVLSAEETQWKDERSARRWKKEIKSIHTTENTSAHTEVREKNRKGNKHLLSMHNALLSMYTYMHRLSIFSWAFMT